MPRAQGSEQIPRKASLEFVPVQNAGLVAHDCFGTDPGPDTPGRKAVKSVLECLSGSAGEAVEVRGVRLWLGAEAFVPGHIQIVPSRASPRLTSDLTTLPGIGGLRGS